MSDIVAPSTPGSVPATPRNLHYGDFYQLTPEATGDSADAKPMVIVHGNCQAEALRVMLDGLFGHVISTMRLVPVHEMTAEDVPFLRSVVARASVVVTQPIVEGYRGLPVGTADLVRWAQEHSATARFVTIPVMRWAGIHPAQCIVRSEAGDPPIVPYHDVRTIVEAARGQRPRLTRAFTRTAWETSSAELRRRIEHHGALDVHDILIERGRRTVHVINHPTNAVLEAVAQRIGAEIDLGSARSFDPGRTLLGSVIAPVEPEAALVAGLEPDASQTWLVNGEPVAAQEIRAAHLAWYQEHPSALAAAFARHQRLISAVEAQG